MSATLAVTNATPSKEPLAPPGPAPTVVPASEHVSVTLERWMDSIDKRQRLDEALLGAHLIALFDLFLAADRFVRKTVFQGWLTYLIPPTTWPILGYLFYTHDILPAGSQVVGIILMIVPVALLLSLAAPVKGLAGRATVKATNVVPLREQQTLLLALPVKSRMHARPSRVGRRIWRVAIAGGLVIATTMELGWVLGWPLAVELHTSWPATAVDWTLDPAVDFVQWALSRADRYYFLGLPLVGAVPTLIRMLRRPKPQSDAAPGLAA